MLRCLTTPLRSSSMTQQHCSDGGIAMYKSDSRILTTHVGSLPRPLPLTELLIRQEQGEAIDAMEFEQQAAMAVRHVIQKQLEAGVDIGNDGEQPLVGFQTYVPQRLRGFGGESQRPAVQDMREFPDFLR